MARKKKDEISITKDIFPALVKLGKSGYGTAKKYATKENLEKLKRASKKAQDAIKKAIKKKELIKKRQSATMHSKSIIKKSVGMQRKKK